MAIVMVASEDGPDYPIELSEADLKRAKKLLKDYERTGDWSEELNTILDNATRINYVGTISTCGDGGGWYKA